MLIDKKITSRMLEDEALGFCYALQCYSSQNETGTEVNPESWTQLKGSNEKGI